jgi:hypothetical protein
MSAGVTALAANEYVEDGNKFSLESNDNAYTTVLIQKGNDTVYVNQDDSAFAAGTNFFLKGTELEEGTYTVKMGGSKTGAAMSETDFVVSSEPEVPEKTVVMTLTNQMDNKDGSYDLGWFAELAVKDCRYIAITANGTETKTVYFNSPFEATGAGDALVAVKIQGVPEAGKDKVSVSFTNTLPSGATVAE